MAGVGNLFSLEHYQTLQKRLAPDGIVCQWLHAYSMSQEDLRMIIRTFSEAFKDVSLWTSYYPDLMLIGKKEPLRLDMKNLEKAFAIPAVACDLNPYGIQAPAGFLSNALLFDSSLRLLSKNARINSDNHPYLEFSAPRSLYKKTHVENLLLLSSFRKDSVMPAIENLTPPRDKNVRFLNALARGLIAKQFDSEAETLLNQASALDPENVETLLLQGLLYFQSGLNPKAEETFLKAIEKDPASGIAYYYLGLKLQDEGQMLKAIEAFKKASTLDPKNATYLVATANALFRIGVEESSMKRATLVNKKGTFEEAKESNSDLIEKYPHYEGGYEWLGELYEKNGKLREAFEIYQKMAGIFPLDASIYISLARLSDKFGQNKNVKKYISIAILCDPSLAKNPEIQKVLHA
jgi:spermidine synthase